MKKDDLVKVIRAIVKQELKKELPVALAQVFKNLMGGNGPSKTANYFPQSPPVSAVGREIPHTPSAEEMPNPQPEELDETALLKQQLREMFNGDATPAKQPAQRSQPPQAAQSKKQYTSNSLLNEVLNQTRPFNSSERMAMRVGGGGVASMAPGVAMAAAEFTPSTGAPGVGDLMNNDELGFMNKIPGMPGADQPMFTAPPTGHSARMTEGQTGGPAPMETMGQASALDFKNSSVLPASIRNVLTRDYRSLVRAMDKGKKK
jgi:hypothetical protein